MLNFKRLFIVLLVFGPIFSVFSAEPIKEGESSAYLTTDIMRAETRYVVNAMEKTHYSRLPLEKIDSKKFLTDYINNFDLNHLIFTQPEVDEFIARFQTSVIVYLKQGNLFPAFEIYKQYKHDLELRIDWVLKRLDQPFDFKDKSTYIPTRKDLPWPKDTKEADELWNNRLKYELLNEILSNSTDKEVVTQLEHSVDEKEADTKPKEEIKDKKPKDDEAKLKEAIENLKKRYSKIVKTLEEIDSKDIEEIYLSTYTQLYDPHSSFMSANTLEEFEVSLHNSLVGIGAILAVEDGYCTIKELLPGGPAEKSGELHPNDQILAVGNGTEGPMVDIVGQQLRKTVQLIRGNEGSKVRLLIKPAKGDPSERKTILVTRREIRLTSNLAEAKLYEIPLQNKTFRIGYIEIPAFYAPDESDPKGPATTRDVKELIHKLKALGAEGLVLDLRRNGGGLLSEAISLTGLFIPIGPVVQVQDAKGNIREYLNSQPDMQWNGPLIILVSRYSASASEIFAGALKIYKRAIIVGDTTTHGKGTVQVLQEITRPLFSIWSKNAARMGATKLTVQKFYLPDGSSTQLKGVSSDIVIPSYYEYLPIAESDLPNALPWDSINTLPWDYGDIGNYADSPTGLSINNLHNMSLQRQKTLPEFIFLSENLSHFKNKQEQKEFTLNYDLRKKQLNSDKEFNDKMEEQLKELTKLKFTSQDVKLDSVLHDDESKEIVKVSAEQLKRAKDTDEHKEKSPHFDIYTRESLRIMADYLNTKSIESHQSNQIVKHDDFSNVSPMQPVNATKQSVNN